jgi:hypothetical protein
MGVRVLGVLVFLTAALSCALVAAEDYRELVAERSVALGYIGQVAEFDGQDYIVQDAQCLDNALVRYCVFNDSSSAPDNQFYWYEGEWHPLRQESLGLPVYIAFTMGEWNEERQNWDFGHAVCALQVGEDEADFDSWYFFQYGDVDIRPGHSQMPSPGLVRIVKPGSIDINGITSETVIAEWELPIRPQGIEFSCVNTSLPTYQTAEE